MRRRSNKYKGVCIRCGKTVESGKGLLGRTRNVFALRHHECVKLDQELKDHMSPAAKGAYKKELF